MFSTTMIKLLYDCRTFGIGVTMEVPALSFNRMCYGYLQNDWITVASSGIALIIAYVSIIITGINHFSKGS